jgi:anaerobic selenocysteine-containing dehydrogenase
MRDSDCVVIMGSNMAENHPVAFRWPMAAKVEHGAKLIHIDPRFTRTSAVADIYAPVRAGSDVAFLGGLVNFIINNERWNTDPFFRTWLRQYTNAPTIIDENFRDTEDNDGTSILDSTSMILCFEGGVGYDPEQDAQGSPHSTENMIVMIRGKARGLHTSPGRHIRKEGDHPTKVINTAMRAVGGPDQLGEVSGSYDELFG